MQHCVWVLVVVAGCGNADCAELVNQLDEAMADLGTCTTAADCGLIGGQQYGSCDPEPYVLACGGVAIANNAPGNARARELVSEMFKGGCAVMQGAYDCAPNGPMECSTDHRCVAQRRSCLPPPPPDAGPPDAGPPEASLPDAGLPDAPVFPPPGGGW
jgi:hypothetical protein